MHAVKVWDGFIRFFHWALVGSILVLYISAENEWMELHFVTGYMTLALLLTRLVWGIVGGETARVSALLHSPKKALASLGAEQQHAGHTAAGSYMVLAFFILLLVQLVTGLMSSDDILSEGPLVAYVPGGWVERATDLHHLNFNLLLAAIALHIAAIVFYRLKGKNLVKVLVTGRSGYVESAPSLKSGRTAFVLFAAILAGLLLTWGRAPLTALLG